MRFMAVDPQNRNINTRNGFSFDTVGRPAQAASVHSGIAIHVNPQPKSIKHYAGADEAFASQQHIALASAGIANPACRVGLCEEVGP
jgi:hypothetical protein